MRAAQFLAIIGRGSKGSNALENTEDRAGATSEQQDNVINTVNSLDPYGPSWQLVPGNVAAGTVYAQVPTSGTGDLTFTRASTKTRTNASGTVVDVASGVAAIDYRNADGSLSSTGRLLLEPQRTNSLQRSEMFSDAVWFKAGTTIGIDLALAPNGTTTADKLIEDSATSEHNIRQDFSSTATGSFIVSIFAKAAERSFFQFVAATAFGATRVNFDLINGTVTAQGVGVTGTILPAGNGWWRCIISATSSGSGTIRTQWNLITSGTAPRVESYTGNGTSGIFIWGAQLEAGAYASSYIPTTTAAVTRLADLASKTGVSSLIGQTEGTIFWEGVFNAGPVTGFSLWGSNAQNSVVIDYASSTIQAYVNTSNVTRLNLTSGTISAGQVVKFAFAYKSGESVLYVNGTQIATSAAAFTFASTLQTINTDWSGYNYAVPQRKSIAQAALFTTRLTNARLAEITTL
jgi:hypothetical protein